MLLNHSYGNILKVALPLMTSGFIQSIVMITDSSFMARYSTLAFDAVGNGGLLYVTMFMCLMGMADGTQIIIARRIGENKKEVVGKTMGSSLLIGACLSIVLFMFLFFLFPEEILYFSNNKIIALFQGEFLKVRSFALFFSLFVVSIQAFFLATGKTSIVLISALITAFVNIFFDYVLIFGHFGFPEMGHQGAAIASNIADFSSMIFLIIALFRFKERRDFGLFNNFGVRKSSILKLLRVGSPLMLQGFIALGTWTLFFTLIESKGEFSLTVSQNIRSIYFLAFVPIWGFAGTTKTYISQYLGAGKLNEISTIQKKIQFLTILFTIVFFHGAFFYPETLIRMINPVEDYVEKSASILRLVSGSILIYGFISVYFQTIHASGNTLHSMLIEISTVFVYALFSYLFIILLDLDIYWIWSVEYIYFLSIGFFSILYLRLVDWKSKKV